MDLTEAEEIKKKWQEYTEELYKKCLNDPDNHDGVVTYLEPDILECESSGPQEALQQTKLEDTMERQLNYFSSEKMLLLKCSSQHARMVTGLEKFSFHSSSKERQCQRMFKLLNNCTHFTC